MKLFKLILSNIMISNAITAQKFIPIDNESNVKFVITNFGLSVDGSFSGVTGTILFYSKNIENLIFHCH